MGGRGSKSSRQYRETLRTVTERGAGASVPGDGTPRNLQDEPGYDSGQTLHQNMVSNQSIGAREAISADKQLTAAENSTRKISRQGLANIKESVTGAAWSGKAVAHSATSLPASKFKTRMVNEAAKLSATATKLGERLQRLREANKLRESR